MTVNMHRYLSFIDVTSKLATVGGHENLLKNKMQHLKYYVFVCDICPSLHLYVHAINAE